MSLNRLRTGFGRAANLMHNWGYSENRLCECGDTHTMTHLLSCSLLTLCTPNDIYRRTNDIAINTVRHWAGTICNAVPLHYCVCLFVCLSVGTSFSLSFLHNFVSGKRDTITPLGQNICILFYFQAFVNFSEYKRLID